MTPKKILAFYLEGCPYCRQARQALNELTNENHDYTAIQIDWVEENQHPEISDKYDYYSVPSMFVNGAKIYEAHRGESYDECKSNVKKVLDSALK